MEQAPEFEQQPIDEAHTEAYQKGKEYLRNLFSYKNEESINKFYSIIREASDVLKFDPEPVIEQVTKNLNLESSEDFVNSSFESLKFIIDKRIEEPELFGRVSRERTLQSLGNIQLSKLMYYNVDLENGTAFIHIAEGDDLGLGEIIKSFRTGLKELAKQVKDDERIKEIQATSWIVEANPGLLKKAGFKYEGLIDEKLKEEHFKDEKRPVGWAHIDREAFLERYLD